MGSAREEVERSYSTRLIHMKQLAFKREFIGKFVTRKKLVIYNVGANPKSKPIRSRAK